MENTRRKPTTNTTEWSWVFATSLNIRRKTVTRASCYLQNRSVYGSKCSLQTL